MFARSSLAALAAAAGAFALNSPARAEDKVIPPELVQPDPDPASGDAIVYLRRLPDNFWRIRGLFFIDGRQVADLGRKGCTAIRAPAGEHLLSQRFRTTDPDSTARPIKLEAGKAYFYEFTIETELGMGVIKPTVTRWFILSVGAGGRQRLAGCKYAPPLLPADAPIRPSPTD